MKFNFHGWKILQCIIIFTLFISFLLISFNHGLIQNVQYSFYLSNERKYEIVRAEVLDINRKDFFTKRDRVLLTVTSIEIFYKVGTEEYTSYVYSYPDMADKEVINVGINIKNPQKVIRCEPYIFNESEKKGYKKYFLILLLIIILFTIINVYIKYFIVREKIKM